MYVLLFSIVISVDIFSIDRWGICTERISAFEYVTERGGFFRVCCVADCWLMPVHKSDV